MRNRNECHGIRHKCDREQICTSAHEIAEKNSFAQNFDKVRKYLDVTGWMYFFVVMLSCMCVTQMQRAWKEYGIHFNVSVYMCILKPSRSIRTELKKLKIIKTNNLQR